MGSSAKLIICGTGSFGELAHYYFSHESPYEVVAFTADREYISRDNLQGLPVVPFDDLKSRYSPDDVSMFIAIGYNQLNSIREKKYKEAKNMGYSMSTFTHPSATIAGNVPIGENCFIFEDQTIQPFVEIGDNVVVWSGNHIGHHTVIEDHSFISSHVVLSGHCRVKSRSFLGVNATVVDETTIAEQSIIGAGATIVEDTEPKGVYVSERARMIGKDSEQTEI